MKIMNNVVALAIMILALAAGGFAKEYKLAENGQSDARIQLNPVPSGSEYAAAVALQDYIKKVSGATIVRSTYPPKYYRLRLANPDFIEILLVTLENGEFLLPPDMLKKLTEAESDEAFYIKTDGDKKIIIAGKKPVGVLYGAYTFLEKYLDVRWFYPGEEGEYCPRTNNITVGEINDFEQPSFEIRGINAHNVKWFDDGKTTVLSDWYIRNKMVITVPYQYPNVSKEQLDYWSAGNSRWGSGGHMMFESAVPVKKYAATHPEYFPLIDGKRHTEEGRFQRCMSNPDVQKLLIDYALEQQAYAYNTNYRFMFAGHDAAQHWCLCPECVKAGTYDGVFDNSTMVHRFFAKFTSEVLRRNPKAILRFNMYTDYRDPPKDPTVRYDERVAGSYAPHGRCYVHRLDDPKCEMNAKMLKDILAWHKIAPKMDFYEFMGCANCSYAVMEYVLADDLKLYKKLGIDGGWMDDCCEPSDPFWETSWQLYYVAAKILWDHTLDATRLLDDAYDKYYGAAVVPMKKYHAFRRELWESAPGHATLGGSPRIGYCLTVPGAEKRLNMYLEEAAKLAAKDAMVMKRIAQDRDYLKTIWGKYAEKLKKTMSGQNDIPLREAEGKIVIDGVLDEEDWRKAPLVTGFQVIKTGAEPKEETRVKVLYDADNWYVGIEAMTEHAWSPLKALVKERDGNVWEDDSVEVFIAPPGGDYCHWVINSIGTYYDAKLTNRDFDTKCEVKTKLMQDRYVVEMRVPAEVMGTKILSGQVWQMHFIRSCLNLQPPSTSEGSSIDGTDAHRQMNFRRAVTGKNVVQNGNFTEVIDTPEKDKTAPDGIKSAKFPKLWNGGNVKLIEGKNNKNSIEFKNGNLWAWWSFVPNNDAGHVINGEIMASGKGQFKGLMKSCVRKPDDKRPYVDEIKHAIGPFDLGAEPKAYKFSLELAPYENMGYLSFTADDAVLDYVSGALEEKKQ